MKKYLVYFKKLFKTNIAYSSNFIFIQILEVVFFLTFFFLWKGVYNDSTTQVIAGYTLNGLITYYFATEFIFRFDVIGSIYLNWDAWDGYLTNWLVKPISAKILCVLDPIVEKSLIILLAVPIYGLIYFFAREYIDFPSVLYLALFFITLFFTFILNIMFNLCVHALVFKLGDQENNIELVNYIAWFLAGGFFPLSFVPGIWGQILQMLPFKYLMYFPANVFLGKYNIEEILLGWLSMFVWILLFYFIFNKIYKNGLKYYTGVGR